MSSPASLSISSFSVTPLYGFDSFPYALVNFGSKVFVVTPITQPGFLLQHYFEVLGLLGIHANLFIAFALGG
jgi:hypothetical protein